MSDLNTPRPVISRVHGEWWLTDSSVGYKRKLELHELRHLIGDICESASIMFRANREGEAERLLSPKE